MVWAGGELLLLTAMSFMSTKLKSAIIRLKLSNLGPLLGVSTSFTLLNLALKVSRASALVKLMSSANRTRFLPLAIFYERTCLPSFLAWPCPFYAVPSRLSDGLTCLPYTYSRILITINDVTYNQKKLGWVATISLNIAN